MKLSLAAALLGQTLPAISKLHGPVTERDGAFRRGTKILEAASAQSILDPSNEQRGPRYKRRVMRQAARNLRNAASKTMVPCDPKSTEADVGILSCGKDHTCEPSFTSPLGGVCTPLESSHQHQGRDSIRSWQGPTFTTPRSQVGQECDPTSIDIGILACGEGQFCQLDETSGRGGFCVDTTTSNSRRLATYYLEDYIYNCGPFPPDYPVSFSCDCSGIDSVTGTGTMFCSQNDTTSYIQGCYDYVVYNFFSYSFENSFLVKATDCYETTKPFVESTCFLYYTIEEEPVCYAEWNGEPCTSCAITNYQNPAFNCSNLDGGPVGDSVQELLSLFDICSTSTCSNFCGEGYFIPDYNFDVNVTGLYYYRTCGELAYYEENLGFSDLYCPYVAAAAVQSFCCAALNSTSAGGDNTTIISDPEPTDNVTIP